MSYIEPCRGQMHGTPGIGTDHQGRSTSVRRPGHGRHLALSNGSGQGRLNHGVGATGPTAQSLVIELYQ